MFDRKYGSRERHFSLEDKSIEASLNAGLTLFFNNILIVIYNGYNPYVEEMY